MLLAASRAGCLGAASCFGGRSDVFYSMNCRAVAIWEACSRWHAQSGQGGREVEVRGQYPGMLAHRVPAITCSHTVRRPGYCPPKLSLSRVALRPGVSSMSSSSSCSSSIHAESYLIFRLLAAVYHQRVQRPASTRVSIFLRLSSERRSSIITRKNQPPWMRKLSPGMWPDQYARLCSV